MTDKNNPINWYPGHMEKAKRQMIERLRAVDMVIEVRDARMPDASTNPMLGNLIQNKPRVIILSKCDMADPVMSDAWTAYLNDGSTLAITLDLSHDPKAGKKLVQACLKVMEEKRQKQIARGIRPRAIRAMACGIPNVGKSTLINRIAGKNTVKAADKPGVTKSLTWIHADPQLDILDTPGVLWPKFDDPRTGTVLAVLGSINDEILDKKMVAMDGIRIIQELYPGSLEKLYECENVNPNGMLKAIATKRHILKAEGELDTRQAAITFLTDLRHGKLGRFTLEKPDESTEKKM
ncbi:MAG: ribosome biogenesis GTPase YlqF [Bulleidia sp.]